MPHSAAKCPYPNGLIRRGGEIVLKACDTEGWFVNSIDYGAHPSQVSRKLITDFEGTQYEIRWTVSGRILSVKVDGHDCEVQIRGGDDPESAAEQIAREMLLAYKK